MNKSKAAHFDLINSSVHKHYDLLALQEPYMDIYNNTKATHNWIAIYPTDHYKSDGSTRSVLLVNKSLNTNHWSQLNFPGKDVTAILLTGNFGKVAIFNIYNDCNHSNTIEALDRYLTRNVGNLRANDTDHMIWLGDFNRHHPLWDEERNSHLFTRRASEEAQKLIELLADYDMVMALPKDIPTLESMATKNWTRPDNIFTTDNTQECIVTCSTDPHRRGPGTDHVPIISILEFHILQTSTPSSYNYRAVEWEKFLEELAIRLEDIPGPQEIESEEELNEIIGALTTSIQETIRSKVPTSKPCPYSKRWWSRELSDRKREKNKLSDLSYKLRALPDHPIHAEHATVRNKYGEAIHRAKLQHWTDWLLNATEREIWIANKYISSPAGDGGRTRIPTLIRKEPNGAELTISTNEEKSREFMSTFFPAPPTVTGRDQQEERDDAVEGPGNITVEQI